MRRLTSLLTAAVVTALVVFILRPQNLQGHRLVGTWHREPSSIAPQTLTFGPDGAGMDGSGVGNFPFRWAARGESGVRVRFTGDAISSSGEVVAGYGEAIRGRQARNWEITFVGPDAVQIDGALFRRSR